MCLGIKLLLFLYCLSLRKRSSQVQVLWEDHRNDLWINGFGMGPMLASMFTYPHALGLGRCYHVRGR